MIIQIEISIVSEEALDNVEKLKVMGIDAHIDDEDVKFVKAWINTEYIAYVEETVGGFNISMVNGDMFFSEKNPFDKLC